MNTPPKVRAYVRKYQCNTSPSPRSDLVVKPGDRHAQIQKFLPVGVQFEFYNLIYDEERGSKYQQKIVIRPSTKHHFNAFFYRPPTPSRFVHVLETSNCPLKRHRLNSLEGGGCKLKVSEGCPLEF